MDFAYYREILRSKLGPERFNHSLRVVDTALEMAAKYNLNLDQVHLAALLHDYAKELPGQVLLETARKAGLITSYVEEIQTDLLHGPVGAYLCRQELGIQDPEVLKAIRYHTTGKADMSMLNTVIYLADLIEPGRNFAGVEELRKISRNDIYQGMIFAYDATIKYVLERRLLIHPLTVEARNWLLHRRVASHE